MGEHRPQRSERGCRFVRQLLTQSGREQFGNLLWATGDRSVGGDRRSLDEQLLLRAEVAHHQSGITAGRSRDGANGGPVVPVLGEQPPGGGEDAGLGPLPLFGT
jgi:hypothetical protein